MNLCADCWASCCNCLYYIPHKTLTNQGECFRDTEVHNEDDVCDDFTCWGYQEEE